MAVPVLFRNILVTTTDDPVTELERLVTNYERVKAKRFPAFPGRPVYHLGEPFEPVTDPGSPTWTSLWLAEVPPEYVVGEEQ